MSSDKRITFVLTLTFFTLQFKLTCCCQLERQLQFAMQFSSVWEKSVFHAVQFSSVCQINCAAQYSLLFLRTGLGSNCCWYSTTECKRFTRQWTFPAFQFLPPKFGHAENDVDSAPWGMNARDQNFLCKFLGTQIEMILFPRRNSTVHKKLHRVQRNARSLHAVYYRIKSRAFLKLRFVKTI